MSGLGYNGPDSPQYGDKDTDDDLATEVTTADSMESDTPTTPSLPDQGQYDGAQEGEQADHGYEQGQGGT